MSIRALIAGLVVLTATIPMSAQAHGFSASAQNSGSPERFNLEFRIGPYIPEISGGVFETVFGDDDSGPLFGLELGVHTYRIPHVGPIGVGFGFARANYTANAFAEGSTTQRSEEETNLEVWPLYAVASLRVDTLAREAGIPFVFVGKVGWDVVLWRSATGTDEDGSGISQGLRWAGQIALELDFLEPRAARNLDEEWGINHAYLFFEYFGSQAVGDLDLGDTTWTAGLGFQF